jgi:anti-anti-sigma factor
MIDATKDTSGCTTVTIRGRFNFACYDEFHRVIGPAEPTSYVIDLRNVDYIDSAALGMLLLLRERVKEDRGRIKLMAGAGQPSEVLKLANFATLFTMS